MGRRNMFKSFSTSIQNSYEGYNADDVFIGWFWDILITEFEDAHKKKFLTFVTGSDVPPLGG